MRSLLAGSLGVALGLCGVGHAEERPAAVLLPPTTKPAAPASLGRPQAAREAAPTRPAPVGRPILQTAYTMPALGATTPFVRAQSADVPQPMPVGPNGDKPVKGVLASKISGNAVPATKPATPLTAGSWGCGEVGSAACGPDACCIDAPCLDGCWQPYRLWANAEYLLWRIKDGTGPALVSTSPAGTPQSQAGVLGTPGATVLFAGNDLAYSDRSGGRFSGGVWFGCEQRLGLEGSFFFLGNRDASFSASSTGVPILARPFFDVRTGINAENAQLVAFPNVLAGSITVASTSRLWGAEANFRSNLYSGAPLWLTGDHWYPGKWLSHDRLGQDGLCDACPAPADPGWCLRIDLLAGFRFLELDERLSITENLSPLPGSGFPAGTAIVVRDNFETRNYFYGGQVGTEWEWRRGRCSFGLLSKIAVGGTEHITTINGSTAFNVPGIAPITGRGGLLALPTNIGRFTTNGFAVVPELGVKIGYQLTNHLRLTVGYTFLYWSEVVRPGDAIDRAINFTQRPTFFGQGTLVGPARPAFTNRDSDFWAQGLNLGLEFRY